MRSDAVSLDVPVKVHGTRMKDTQPNATGEPFEENTSSIIVFPQGGVLKMATPVAAGQMMVVTNLKSGHDAICRVIKVRAYAQGQSYVEIEFTHRQPGYWGVYFPSDGDQAPGLSAPAAANAAPSMAATVAPEAKVDKTEEKSASDPVRTVPPPLKIPAKPAAKKDSAFAPIGSKEDVQPAAAPTSTRVKSRSIVEPQTTSASVEAAPKSMRDDLPPLATPSTAPTLAMSDLQGDASRSSFSFAGAGVPGEIAEIPSAEEPSPAVESAPAFGRFAASASLSGGHAPAREPFGSTFGSGLSIAGDSGKASQRKGGYGLAIAASVIIGLGVAGGAAYYFHLLPFGAKPAAKSASIIVPPAAPPVDATTSQPASAGIANPSLSAAAPAIANNPAPQPASTAPREPATANNSGVPTPRAGGSQPSPAKAARLLAIAPAPAPAAASAPATPKTAAKVPDMFGALNAHPTARTYSGDAAAAPDVSGGEASDSGLPAISAPSAIAAPTPIQEGPVRIRVGGALKPPRLISSTLPVYPPMALQTGIEGDVVIDTFIDKNGTVTSAKVVSGAPVLRQAALDALHHWKYEPSKLNGDPVAVEMMVTIKFHHQ